jgi:uncharacterized SAM-binding protein YcdF (DUF218 family)
MFVFLKILLFFFRPLTWIVILFVTAFFIKNARRKKICFIAGLSLLLFFSNPFIITALINSYEYKPLTLQPNERFTAGIVLGGFVGFNEKDDRGYFNASSDRFIQTALLYKEGKIRKIIVAAGNGYITRHQFVEADFIKQHLITLGIPASDVYTDGLSKNTEQNAINAKKIIDSLQLPGPFLLITSAFHLPRAQMVFRKNKIETKGFPCDFISRQVSNNIIEDYLLPSSGALRNWDLYIKEIVGVTAYRITGKG